MRLYRVKGISMHPFLMDDDLVVVKKVSPGCLKKGNILVFRDKTGNYIIHRGIGKPRNGHIYARGDGYNLPAELVQETAILGKAIGMIRDGKLTYFNRLMELYFWAVSLLKGQLISFQKSRKDRRNWPHNGPPLRKR